MSLKFIHIIGHSLPAITLVLGLPMVILDIAQRYSYARALGTISLLLFILTLIPGIIRRFELTQTSWGKTLTQLILPIRRQLGIAMFLTAIWHAMGLRWEVFQGVIETGVPPEPPLFEILGTLSADFDPLVSYLKQSLYKNSQAWMETSPPINLSRWMASVWTRSLTGRLMANYSYWLDYDSRSDFSPLCNSKKIIIIAPLTVTTLAKLTQI